MLGLDSSKMGSPRPRPRFLKRPVPMTPPKLAGKELARRLPKAPRGALTAALVVALVVGIQLGGVPWRYRKQLWQLQGAIAGAVAGYLVGRWSRPEG